MTGLLAANESKNLFGEFVANIGLFKKEVIDTF